jgi:hypothetical protein
MIGITRYQGEAMSFKVSGSIEQGLTLSAKISRIAGGSSTACTVTPETGYWMIDVPNAESLTTGDYRIAIIIKSGSSTIAVEDFTLSILPQP